MNSPHIPVKGSAKNPISVTSSLDSDYPDEWKSKSRNSLTVQHGSSSKRSPSRSTVGSAASRGSLSSSSSAASLSNVESASAHGSAATSTSALIKAPKHAPSQGKPSGKFSIPEILPGLTIRSGMLVSAQSVRDGVDHDSYDFHESTQVHRMRCIPSECNRKLWDEARAKAEAMKSANSSKRSSRKNSVDADQFAYNGSVSSGHTSASSVTSNGSQASSGKIFSQKYTEERKGSSAH